MKLEIEGLETIGSLEIGDYKHHGRMIDEGIEFTYYLSTNDWIIWVDTNGALHVFNGRDENGAIIAEEAVIVKREQGEKPLVELDANGCFPPAGIIPIDKSTVPPIKIGGNQ